jgi:integrase
VAHAEASAKTVESAVAAAAAELGLLPDQVDVEVIEEAVPSTFGVIGSPARVRVTARNPAAATTARSADEEAGATARAATATLTAGRQRGFSGQVLTIAEQRRLYRRWTSDPQTHPHECLVGLFALLHGAAGAELRGLRIADLDPARRTVRLGRRPHPVPLDPASWLALERCLALRAELGTHNPHLLVTRVTKTGTAPASEAYLAHVLDPAGVPPRRLRATRLADLVVTLDPKLVAEAFGLDPDGVLAYLADHVQEARLPNLPAATPAELAEHPGGAR